MIIEDHLLPQNVLYSQARIGTKIDLIVVHWTAGYSLSDAENAFKTRRTSGIYHPSANYGVDGDSVWRFVPEERIAYQAGNWGANRRSLGIEHVGYYEQPVKDETYITSGRLISEICKRYGLEPNDKTIQPHRNFSATSCPGTLDVGRLIGEARKDYLGLNPAPVVPLPPPPLPILDIPAPVPVLIPTVPVPVPDWPRTITVTAVDGNGNAAYGLIRSAKDKGNNVVYKRFHGTPLTAVDLETGNEINGSNMWYRLNDNNYISATVAV